MASDALGLAKQLLGARGRAVGLDERRERLDALATVVSLPVDTHTEYVDVDGVPSEWVWVGEPGPEAPTLLYFHGGAYTAGSHVSHRPLVAHLAEASGAWAIHVDYRRAPEHPFPAAVDDGVAVYRWLLEQGTDPHRLAVAGDSAGGGLAVAVLVAARDAGLSVAAAALLLSPWTDLACTGASHRTRAEVDVSLDAEHLRQQAGLYLDGADPRHPLASPLYADLRDLPPLLVHVGDEEVLLDDSVALVGRARSAGVDARLDVVPEVFHVWHALAGLVPESDTAVAAAGAWLAEQSRT